MRYVNYCVAFSLLLSELCILSPVTLQAQTQVGAIPPGTPTCVPVAPAGYPGKACKVNIDRDAPVSPPTLLMPGSTAVYLELDDSRWDESVTFSAAIARSAMPNLLVDALTSLASPLSSLQGSFRTLDYALRVNVLPLKNAAPSVKPQDKAWRDEQDRLTNVETSIGDGLADASNTVQAAATEFTCLENFRQFDPASASCIQTAQLDHTTVANAFQKAITDAAVARNLPLPLSQIGTLTTDLTKFDMTCQGLADADSRKACITASSSLQSTEVGFTNTVKDIQTLQDTLRQVLLQVGSVSPNSGKLYFEIKQPFLRTAVVTLTGTEVVTKTATTIATFTINWQETAFVLSTGLLGSGLANKTYALSSVIVNGVVQPDPNNPTKNLSVVNATSIQPAMDFPAVFGSWVLPLVNRWGWENRCPGHCGFLLSGGVALNLTSKTADFAVGPSLQAWGLLVTPSLVWGRQTVLTDGITVGYTGFGSNPPTSLPTATAWKKAFGIALTYTLPTP